MKNRDSDLEHIRINRPIALLFVKLDLGGIETYFAKLSHTLVQERNVIVCALIKERHSGLMAMFNSSVQVVSPLELAWLIMRCWKCGLDLLATGRNTALWAVVLQFFFPYLSVRLGIYSQYELGERSVGILRRAYAWVYRRLEPKHIFFCTQGLKDKQVGLDPQYDVSAIVPLTVSPPTFCKHNATCETALKIITIGRFVDFKRYLWILPSVVTELDNIGIQVFVEIYGYGPLEESLKVCIEQSPSASKISIKGKINPQDIDKALFDADLFIGSGSMLLEAASRGLPSIVCIDSNQAPTSPGYLHELPLNYTSEERINMPMFVISELVQRFVNKDAKTRNSIIKDSFEYCKHYDPKYVGESLLGLFNSGVRD